MEKLPIKSEIKGEIVNDGLAEKIEKITRVLDETMSLEITSNGINELHAVATERMRTYTVNDYAFEMPIYTHEVVGKFDEIAEFIDSKESEIETYDQKYESFGNKCEGSRHMIDDEDFEKWKAELISPESIKLEAQEMLANREVITGNETIDCGNCRGDGEVKTSGKVYSCPCCFGAGYAYAYPTIHFINAEADGYQTLTLDLLSMIANGEVELEAHMQDRTFSEDPMTAEYSIDYSFKDYFAKAIANLGYNPDHTMVLQGGHIKRWNQSEYYQSIEHVFWRKNNGKVEINDRKRGETIPEKIDHEQKSIAHSYAWPGVLLQDIQNSPDIARKQALDKYGHVLDGNFIAQESVLQLRPVESLVKSLNTLIGEVESLGYTLGFANSFIATGETGPSFYLMRDHKFVQQISNEYTLWESLENALYYIEQTRQDVSGSL